MLTHRAITALLVGSVAALGAGGYVAWQVVKDLQARGVTVNLPVGGRVHVTPPSGGGQTFELSANAQATMNAAPRTIGLAAAAGIIAAFLLTSGKE